VFVVPTSQLLSRRAQRNPAQAEALPDGDAGGEDAGGSDDGDSSDENAQDEHPRKKSRQALKTPAQVVGYAKQSLGKVDKLLASVRFLAWSREAVERMLARVNAKTKVMNRYSGELDRLQLRVGNQILVCMTAATRQLKVLQEVLLAIRRYFNDSSDRARPMLLDTLVALERSYAAALETLTLSTPIMLEAGARGLRHALRGAKASC
jgi:hypothetical protein